LPPFFCSMKLIRMISAIFFLLLTAVSCTGRSALPEEKLPVRVIHGGGMLWDVDSCGVYRSFAGSNSREGLLRCADAGVSFVEIDFSFTADGELVCIHGWDNEYIAEIEDGVPLSFEEFRQSRIFGCFTPMTAADAAGIMRENEDLTLVTDIKERFCSGAEVIADEFSDLLDRVVLQIYSEEQYDYAVGLGFSRIAYTLYELPWEDKLDADAHIRFAREHDLEWIAFSHELCTNAVFVEKMTGAGVPLFVHTVNDEKTEKYLLDRGISGVYTDNIK